MKLTSLLIWSNFIYQLYFLYFIVFSKFCSPINQYFIFFLFLLIKRVLKNKELSNLRKNSLQIKKNYLRIKYFLIFLYSYHQNN